MTLGFLEASSCEDDFAGTWCYRLRNRLDNKESSGGPPATTAIVFQNRPTSLPHEYETIGDAPLTSQKP